MALSYGRQLIDDDDIRAVVAALKSDFLTQGPAVAAFERDICSQTGAKYCVAVANATAGLHIAVAALGLEPGTEGITSPNTFLASANCLAYNGLVPCFADIDPKTYNISPEKIRERVTPKTRVLIPVDFAGQACRMAEIKAIAEEKGLFVIEDAAHAIGSQYADGSYVGGCRYSDMTVFSFHPVKTITTGEGGAITTNDEKLYRALVALRSHGMTKNPDELTRRPGRWYYEMRSLGFNYRLTDLQAALGSSQLKKLASFKERRRRIVDAYNKAFAALPWFTRPYEEAGLSSCFHLYAAQLDFGRLGRTREEVMGELQSAGIGTQVHYIPVHLQPFYRERYGYREGDYPEAERYYERELSLPLFPGMADDDVQQVIDAVVKLGR